MSTNRTMMCDSSTNSSIKYNNLYENNIALDNESYESNDCIDSNVEVNTLNASSIIYNTKNVTFRIKKTKKK